MSDTTGVIGEVLNEYYNATAQYGFFNSANEGYDVILEELDELKEEVFKKSQERNIKNMKKEAIQVAAMAIRFITDICDEKNNE